MVTRTSRLQISALSQARSLGIQHNVPCWDERIPETEGAPDDGYGLPADVWSYGCVICCVACGKEAFYDVTSEDDNGVSVPEIFRDYSACILSNYSAAAYVPFPPQTEHGENHWTTDHDG
eukprot:TRINITY_DN11001_c0_g1_i1.p2 TRINITY_DN11001_c0_g1~~TRINITY_DN11001_c0_g1_i1.p2  ORF type:complete len:120 (+),score=8.94 TRINITY_DN11001_c0_g1_i1:130-489(+)